MIAVRGMHVGPPALLLAAVGVVVLFTAPAAALDDPPAGSAAGLPFVRRIKVPASRPEVWPRGDWQPIPLAELERRLTAAQRAARGRPDTFVERAEYTATLIGALFTEARLEWFVRRADAGPRLLPLGRLNLNVANLEWSEPGAFRPGLEARRVSEGAAESRNPALPRPAMRALWGADPAGRAAIVIDRPRGSLAGDWNLPGRKLAASTEFDIELCPAEISRLALKVPAGLVLSASAGELSGPAAASQPGWNEWRLNLGSRTACRLRVAAPPDAGAERPLVLVRSSLNYFLKSEACRVLGDFEIDVLESSRREFRLTVDPEVQVTAVEFGDDSATAWRTEVTSAGQKLVVQLPDSIAGAGHTLQVQGIAQVKQFGPWTLPRIRIDEAVEVSGKVTLGLQPPSLPADIRTDGYRQVELSSGIDEGEVLVFRQIRSDGAITIVPADMKAELACRAVTHIQADPQQWSMESDWEWQAASGSTFAASCVVPETWEVVDVRSAGNDQPRELSGWEVQTADSGRQILQLYFLNALKPGRSHSVRISARRLPPAAGESTSVPPLVPAETSAIEQLVVATTGSDWRPVVDDAQGLERLSIRDVPAGALRLDFLRTRLAQRAARSVVLKAVAASAKGTLHVEPASVAHGLSQPTVRLAEDGKNSPGSGAESRGDDFRTPVSAAQTEGDGGQTGKSASPVALEVRVKVGGQEPGFDHYVAAFRFAGANRDSDFRWRLAGSGELTGVFYAGRRLVPQSHENAYSVMLPLSAQVNPLSAQVNGVQQGDPDLRIEYRVRAGMHRGPNSRQLVLPETDRPVLLFELALMTPDSIRLEGPLGGISLNGDDREPSWRSKLWGALAGPFDRSIFNPLSGKDWLSWQRPVAEPAARSPGGTVWRDRAAAPPPPNAGFVIWEAREVSWLSWMLLLAASLTGLVARLLEARWRRGAAVAGLAGLALAALALSPVLSELAGSALTGLVLALLLPKKFLIFPKRPARDGGVDFPVGSTQSFVSMTALVLAGSAIALCLTAQAQEKAAPSATTRPAEAAPNRPLVDILIPTDAAGAPAGNEPLAYAPSDLLAMLKPFADATAIPDYLIGASTFEETVDEANRRSIRARYEVHVFGSQSQVAVRLALGGANLGGDDACLVDGLPHAVRVDAEGRGLIVELPGPEPLPDAPALPETRAGTDAPIEEGGEASNAPDKDAMLRFRTYSVVLHLYPPVSPEKMKVAARAQVQAGVSCLADVSGSLIELHYHVAYRVAAGFVDSLLWRVPEGLVLEGIQAPQLAGYRFSPRPDGGRNLLIEFSKSQHGDFSLSATFAVAIDQNQRQIVLPLVNPLLGDEAAGADIGLQFHQFAARQPSELRLTFSAAPPGASLKPRSVDEFLREWNAGGARPQQAFELDRTFELGVAVESVAAPTAAHGAVTARFHPDRLDWTYTAEVLPNAVPQFVYRLIVDSRLRIKTISVQEDGAERLLRWSQMRDAVILFLNDRAARAQTVRIDASLPVAASHEFELPRARFSGAPPEHERITIYRDEAVAVRFSHPEDAPAAPPGDSGSAVSRERLFARLELSPEQSAPHVVIEPVLPRISAETATVVEESGDSWRCATCVQFLVASGRATELALEVPETSAAQFEIRSVPDSRFTMRPGPAGRATVTFYPDEPVLDRFVAVLTAKIDRPLADGPLPVIGLPGIEQTAMLLVAPPGILRPLPSGSPGEAVPVAGWIREVASAAALPGFESYRLPVGARLEEFLQVRRASTRTTVESSRVDLWIELNGSIDGWLGLKVAEGLPSIVDLDWPATARPTGLAVDGVFRSLPVAIEGRLPIAVPAGAAQREVWVSWHDEMGPLPAVAASLPIRVPWPREFPTASCRVDVHAPRQFRVEGKPPLIAVLATPQPENLPASLAVAQPNSQPHLRHTVMEVFPVPAAGQPFELGASLRVINEAARSLIWALAVVIPAGLVLWWAGAFWRWLVQHETASWLVLSVFWWLCLAPSWLGLVIAVWAGTRALRNRGVVAEPVSVPPQASHVP